MFEGRKLVIATKHQKEVAIAPVLEAGLGVQCMVPADLDTDSLGTFTGEVERSDDPVTTARKKCHLALEVTGCDLGVASEGSFGPHPSMFFIPADDEILVFVDSRNGLELVVRELSTQTNFAGAEIRSENELKEFAERALFPAHGLILRKSPKDPEAIVKGIRDWSHLKSEFHAFLDQYGSAYVETDMRAMHNPSRMKVIADAAQKLTLRLRTTCPACETPGFGVSEAKKGLPCALCQYPTRSVLSYIHTCLKCSYTKEEMFPKGIREEDPMYCDVCNP